MGSFSSSPCSWCSATPRGVKQPMSSWRRQKPMRQVAMSQEAALTVQKQEKTRTRVAVHLVLRQSASLLMKLQQNLRARLMVLVTSISPRKYNYKLNQPPTEEIKRTSEAQETRKEQRYVSPKCIRLKQAGKATISTQSSISIKVPSKSTKKQPRSHRYFPCLGVRLRQFA